MRMLLRATQSTQADKSGAPEEALTLRIITNL